ncbi:alpha/beta fold hydrolase [Fangia hongkongensis]|nr:alpha/beta fold hydrolase [Fangia hongkongensis]MBK2126207.1 alpha/beta hydrolase [Fangia hongkongensis]
MVNKEFNLFDKTCKGYDPLEAAKAAYQIMFYPKKRNKYYRTERDLINKTDKSMNFSVNNKEVTTYHWNQTSNKKVLLVHGFGGRCLDFSGIINLLCNADFHVIGFDAPAHGLSEGSNTDIGEFMECISQISLVNGGGFDLAITHSFGAGALTYEMRNKSVQIKQLGLIAPNATFPPIIKGFLNVLNAEEDVYSLLSDLIVDRFKNRMNRDELWSACSPVENISLMKHSGEVDLCIMHGKFDKMLPIDQSEYLLETCRSVDIRASLNIFDCGHYDILKNPNLYNVISKKMMKLK